MPGKAWCAHSSGQTSDVLQLKTLAIADPRMLALRLRVSEKLLARMDAEKDNNNQINMDRGSTHILRAQQNYYNNDWFWMYMEEILWRLGISSSKIG